jgi:nucleotide-binding universal stress UspA family protein
MFKNVLIATDGTELAGKAVTQGLALAKALNARVTAVSVTEPWAATAPPEILTEAFVQDYEKAAAARAKQILEVVAAAAKDANVPCFPLHVRDRFPAEGILEAATGAGCDLIVMASHGRRGLAKLLLGSQATEVLTHSTVPVLICR